MDDVSAPVNPAPSQETMTEYQCGRCGSTLVWEPCENCNGAGGFPEDDPDCCDTWDGWEVCMICLGQKVFPYCCSTEPWCKNHPLPGREDVSRHTPESFEVALPVSVFTAVEPQTTSSPTTTQGADNDNTNPRDSEHTEATRGDDTDPRQRRVRQGQGSYGGDLGRPVHADELTGLADSSPPDDESAASAVEPVKDGEQ